MVPEVPFHDRVIFVLVRLTWPVEGFPPLIARPIVVGTTAMDGIGE
jgi:hypothetical protein